VLAVAAAWLFIVHQLRELLAALGARETFARRNALRLRRIGWAVIAFELGHGVAVWGGGLYLEHAVLARGVTLRAPFGIDVPVIVLGMLLLALAAAFRVGSELAAEAGPHGVRPGRGCRSSFTSIARDHGFLLGSDHRNSPPWLGVS
jgi:hypothetical protein